jgi:hypothetical protein
MWVVYSSYANSVQVRLSVWDFLLVFGTLDQQTAGEAQLSSNKVKNILR